MSEAAKAAPAQMLPKAAVASARGRAPTFRAVGFWKRLAAGIIDAAVVVPLALVLTWIVGKLLGFKLPPALAGDYWIDLLVTTDPGMVAVVVLLIATSSLYLLLFQAVLGRTLGMRALRCRVIDIYGDAPTVGRAALRTAGALVCVATLGLGFLWIGFDSEKRGLHDWIASTYVVKS